MKASTIIFKNSELIIKKIFSYSRFFSIDIVAGVIASVFFSAHVMGGNLPLAYFIVIAITTWLIYVADHLLDSFKAGRKDTSQRYRFFHTYRIPLILLFLIILVYDYRYILYHLEGQYIEFGISLGGASFIYLLMRQLYRSTLKIFFIKEVWVSIIYTLAVWGGPVISAGNKISLAQGMIMTAFGLLIFSNVLIFSFFNKKIKRSEELRSFATDFGYKLTRYLIYISVISVIAMALFVWFISDNVTIPVIILNIIGAGYLLIISKPDFFSKGGKYGILADLLILVFLLTLIG